jgi:hypothetical protein
VNATLIRALALWMLLLPQAYWQPASGAAQQLTPNPASASAIQGVDAKAAPGVQQQVVPTKDLEPQKQTSDRNTKTDGVADKGQSGRNEELRYPALPVLCIRVIDRTIYPADGAGAGSSQKEVSAANTRTLPAAVAGNPPAKQTRAAQEKAAIAQELARYGSCSPLESPEPLLGTGDILIAIHPDAFDDLREFERKTAVPVGLYVNGVFLGDDAEPVGRELFPHAALLHFNIKPGEYSRRLWSALYRDGSTTQLHRLSAGLGWYNAPRSTSLLDKNRIAITSKPAFWLGIGFIVLIIALAVWLGVVTDIFRDAKTPEAFHRAMQARKLHRRNADTEDNLLRRLYPGYTTEVRLECTQLAEEALKGTSIKTDSVNKVAAGLFLCRDQWASEKSSYSLGRSQLGLWFLFAIATGLYLLIIYGDLPALDGSLLGLLGLSLGVTGMSLAIDKNNPPVEFKPSQGILRDLITGWDDQYQVYRFQAVIVNLLLLVVGILHVFSHLSYPIFEPTWLAFLGISGLAYGAGKQITRNEAPVSKRAVTAPVGDPAKDIAEDKPL